MQFTDAPFLRFAPPLPGKSLRGHATAMHFHAVAAAYLIYAMPWQFIAVHFLCQAKHFLRGASLRHASAVRI